MPNSKLLPLISVLVTVVLWASVFVGIRSALHTYEPIPLATFRFAVASLVFLAIYAVSPFRLPRGGDLLRSLACGAIGITAFNIAINYGERTVTAGSASFIVNMVPIFTAVLASIFLKERVSVWGWVGVSIAFSGVGLIALGESDGADSIEGVFFLILAAVFQAIFFVLQKPLLLKYTPLQAAALVIWSGTLFLLPLSFDVFSNVRDAALIDTISVIYLGIFPAAIGYITWGYALSHWPASRTTSFLYLVPIVALMIGLVWLGEWPSLIALVGGVVALCGVLITNTLGQRH